MAAIIELMLYSGVYLTETSVVILFVDQGWESIVQPVNSSENAGTNTLKITEVEITGIYE